MYRARLDYVRKRVVLEKGYVTVDVDDLATIGDVYAAAYSGDFTEKLAQDQQDLEDQWDFKFVKENHDQTPTPRVA